uniref:Uncharacterized protein n=1 Tax=Sander lucioperca TaxID=283035 RepID=A0A8C9ZDQ4_SANLU
MPLFGKLCSGGGKARKMACPCQLTEMEKLPEREEMLMNKKDFLMTKIDQELLVAKKNSIRNRRGETYIYKAVDIANSIPCITL